MPSPSTPSHTGTHSGIHFEESPVVGFRSHTLQFLRLWRPFPNNDIWRLLSLSFRIGGDRHYQIWPMCRVSILFLLCCTGGLWLSRRNAFWFGRQEFNSSSVGRQSISLRRRWEWFSWSWVHCVLQNWASDGSQWLFWNPSWNISSLSECSDLNFECSKQLSELRPRRKLNHLLFT